MKHLRVKLLISTLLALLSISGAPILASAHRTELHRVQHVLLISVDGLHAIDLENYVENNPDSTLASLSQIGTTYTHASTSRPSDSFPGLLSMTTGGTPRSTGVFYDDTYDRRLSPPGSNCATKGTEVVYDESIDIDSTVLNGGGGINPAALPLDPAHGCTPVYPHSYLRVNTIFEVARSAGLHTAWADKHLAYDLLNGPSGKGVEDLYTPEIAANDATSSVSGTEANDNLKVQAILNEIDGKDHTGTKKVGVPAIFGMNFQAVSVAQKLPTGGYIDGDATPTPELQDALSFVDASLSKMVNELQTRHLFSSTLIIITAKHGQSPIDPSQRLIVDSKLIPSLVNSVQPGLLAQATQDDVSLLWLTDQSKTQAVVKALRAHASQAHIKDILYGKSLQRLYNSPTKDSRTPDIIIQPETGVIYTKPTATKIAEHGGFSTNDTNVALLLANPALYGDTINSAVETTQIAPTILRLLGLRPEALQAVRQEKTRTLPYLCECEN